MYRKAILEARVLNKLSHKNVLSLLGIYIPKKDDQIALLIELAPKGDLKSVVSEFKKGGIKLSRRTIRATLIQVGKTYEVCTHTPNCFLCHRCLLLLLLLLLCCCCCCCYCCFCRCFVVVAVVVVVIVVVVV